MSTTSPFLKLVLQDLDENPDTWGNVLNVSGLEALEDAIAGTATISYISAADYTLNDNTGGPTASDGARYMILNITGSPGGPANLIVPTRSKVYLAVNSTGQTITVKTSAGTGVAVPDGEAFWVYCDGTNVEAATVSAAVTAASATTAADATALGGYAAALYARLAAAQTWTAGQVTASSSVVVAGAGPYTLTVNCSLSNAFYHLTTQNFTLQAPTNAASGQRFSLLVEQGATGPHTIAFQSSTFQFTGSSAPALSTTVGAVDYLAFERYTHNTLGTRWVGSIIKNIGDV